MVRVNENWKILLQQFLKEFLQKINNHLGRINLGIPAYVASSEFEARSHCDRPSNRRALPYKQSYRSE